MKWIKIEDEQPSAKEYVLVNCYSGYGGEDRISIAMRDDNSWYDIDDYYSYKNVGEVSGHGNYWIITHWIPIPKPPEKDGLDKD